MHNAMQKYEVRGLYNYNMNAQILSQRGGSVGTLESSDVVTTTNVCTDCTAADSS